MLMTEINNMRSTIRPLYVLTGILLVLVIALAAVGCQPTAPDSPKDESDVPSGTVQNSDSAATTTTTVPGQVQVPDNWSGVYEDDTDGITTSTSASTQSSDGQSQGSTTTATTTTTTTTTTKGDGWLPGYY